MCAMTLTFAMDAMQQRNIPMGMSQMSSNPVTFFSMYSLAIFYNLKTFYYKNFQIYLQVNKLVLVQ